MAFAYSYDQTFHCIKKMQERKQQEEIFLKEFSVFCTKMQSQ